MYVNANCSAGGVGRGLTWCPAMAKVATSASLLVVPIERGGGGVLCLQGLTGPADDMEHLGPCSI